jgi:hypothetical protein
MRIYVQNRFECSSWNIFCAVALEGMVCIFWDVLIECESMACVRQDGEIEHDGKLLQCSNWNIAQRFEGRHERVLT